MVLSPPGITVLWCLALLSFGCLPSLPLNLCDSSSCQGGRGLATEAVDLVPPPDCTHCPAGTEPAVGFEYKWWNTLPSNMETTVLSGINFEYKGMTGKCILTYCEMSAPCSPPGAPPLLHNSDGYSKMSEACRAPC